MLPPQVCLSAANPMSFRLGTCPLPFRAPPKTLPTAVTQGATASVSAPPLPLTQPNVPGMGSTCAGAARDSAVSVPCPRSSMPHPTTLS